MNDIAVRKHVFDYKIIALVIKNTEIFPAAYRRPKKKDRKKNIVKKRFSIFWKPWGGESADHDFFYVRPYPNLFRCVLHPGTASHPEMYLVSLDKDLTARHPGY